MNKKITFKGQICSLVKTRYPKTQQSALQLLGEKGEPFLTASVCIPEEDPKLDEIFIKSWSENAGIRKALIDNGIIGPVEEYIPIGFVQASKHKLLI
jgi:hypothetical protein